MQNGSLFFFFFSSLSLCLSLPPPIGYKCHYMFPFDPPPPTILPYFINTNRLIVSSCVFSCIMTLEPVHKLVTGVILSVAIPSPQFGLVCCAGLCIIANTMPCGSNEILPYGKDCHFFCEY